MTKQQYLNALKKLELHPHGCDARLMLGLKARQLARLASGQTKPSPTLVRLLSALITLKLR